MRRQRRSLRLLALIGGFALLAAACGGDDDDSTAEESGEETGDAVQGGEFVDLGTFVGDPPEHIDPGLNTTVDAYQVVGAIYDGLTEIDASDPDSPQIVPQVAESYEANDDATEWTFTIREDLKFSNGEDVLPSSFARAWDRASDPDFAGDYSYLFTFIEGGEERLAGEADEISGVTADDEAMTLTVELSAPYSNFDAVAGFQIFMPMPEAVEELDDQADWENGLMIGNGPFMLEAPRNDQEIVLVPNDEWDGTKYDEALDLPADPFLDKITLRTLEDPDTSYNSFEAGEGDTGQIPPDRVDEAQDTYETTLDVQILGSYQFDIKMDHPVVGGPENKLLRQAISQAIDRELINDRVYNNSRTVSTGITPPGIPGHAGELCEFCAFDLDAAQQAFDDWKAEGNELTEPLKIQFNLDAGHEPVVDILIENLSAIGIPAEREGIDTETYFSQLSDGACVICRAGWFADYPTYDNFMFDLFHSTSIGGNNLGFYDNPDFDALVEEGKETVDKDEQAELFQEAEQILLNDDIGTIPIVWYRGDYAFNGDRVANFGQTNFGLIIWEKVSLKEGAA